MVYAGFRQDIQDPPDAQAARASPNPHNEEYMYARPDQEEMEEAINKFLVQLEWTSSDTTSVCWQSWKAFLMHQATSTLLTLMSRVITTLMWLARLESATTLQWQAMLNRDAMLIRLLVRSIPCCPRLYHVILSYPILHMGYLDWWTLCRALDPTWGALWSLIWTFSSHGGCPHLQLPSSYPLLSLVMHVYHRISWDIPG